MIKVLVVDDSALVRKLFGRVLSSEGDIEPFFARNGVEALAMLEQIQPDVITLDIQMPEMDGLTCLDRIMVERPCPVLMVSSLTAEGAEITFEALRLGAVDFVAKPDGTVSLHIDEFGPLLVSKIRSVAQVKIKASLRLRERVRHRMGAAPPLPIKQGDCGSVDRSARAVGGGVVLVGTSTGGPPALEALLGRLPATFPWPIVIAQHMPANFTGPLAERLDRLCAVRVSEVTRTTVLEPGRAYIGRGDADIILSRQNGALVAATAPSEASYPWHPSADRLVRTGLNHVSPAQLIGILMTGMGNDGAEAMTALRALGGRTIAEAEETAVVWGMPGELVKANGADWVLPVGAISDKLQLLVPAHASHPKRS